MGKFDKISSKAGQVQMWRCEHEVVLFKCGTYMQLRTGKLWDFFKRGRARGGEGCKTKQGNPAYIPSRWQLTVICFKVEKQTNKQTNRQTDRHRGKLTDKQKG